MSKGLQNIREKKGLSREALAHKVGYSGAFLANIERQPKALAPNHPVVPKLARALGVPESTIKTYAKREPLAEVDVRRSVARAGRQSHANGNGNGSGNGNGDTKDAIKAALRESPTALKLLELSEVALLAENFPTLKGYVRDAVIRTAQEIFG